MVGCLRDQPVAVVLVVLLIAGAVADANVQAQPLPVQNARSRKLQGVSIIPTGITANIAGTSIPLSLPQLLGGTGTPSTDSPRKFYRVSCDKPKPTFVVVPGLSGSQLDATSTGGVGGCPGFSSPRQVYADLTWLKNLPCFAHLLSAGYDHSTGRYFNSSGTQMWAFEGGFPDGSTGQLASTFFADLWRHMESYGYRRGVDMVMAVWDWRWDYDGLNQIGAYEQIAARVQAAVDQNCGQKAVILAHSMGASVILRMLREPRFQAWKQQYVKAIILAGPTLSGASPSTWQGKLSGIMDPFPALTNMIPAFKLSLLPITPFEAAIYQGLFGMPSFLVVTPGYEPLGRDQVIVRTPSRDYTIGQQKELLRDMGDEQSLALFDKVLAQSKALLDAGPIPGIESYCIYGINQPTPMTLEYGEDIRKGQVMRRPRNIIKVPGDGTVDLKTLRLCSKVVPASNIVELTDPAADHTAIIRQPVGMAGLDGIFAKLGMIKGAAAATAQQVDNPVSNRPAAQSSVVEERGKQG